MIAKHLCPYLLVAAVAVATWAGGQGATLTLEADPAPGGSRTYDFRAEIVGGSDNDRALYCLATTWDFGDGPPMTSTPGCAPWTPDTKIQRRFATVHTYEEPGNYVVRFEVGPLSARRAIEVK